MYIVWYKMRCIQLRNTLEDDVMFLESLVWISIMYYIYNNDEGENLCENWFVHLFAIMKRAWFCVLIAFYLKRKISTHF